jgi:hypothetical protein
VNPPVKATAFHGASAAMLATTTPAFAANEALLEKVIFGLDYYHVTDDPAGVGQDLVQVDANVKF